MSALENKLNTLGLKLKEPKVPVANYIGSKRSGECLFVSGRVSELRGAVGKDVTEAEAKSAARETVLLILAIVKKDIVDLDLIKGVIKMQGFIHSASTFTNQHLVLDGASDLLVELFDEEGKHARTATGVAQLPFGATIQLDLVFQMKS